MIRPKCRHCARRLVALVRGRPAFRGLCASCFAKPDVRKLYSALKPRQPIVRPKCPTCGETMYLAVKSASDRMCPICVVPPQAREAARKNLQTLESRAAKNEPLFPSRRRPMLNEMLDAVNGESR